VGCALNKNSFLTGNTRVFAQFLNKRVKKAGSIRLRRQSNDAESNSSNANRSTKSLVISILKTHRHRLNSPQASNRFFVVRNGGKVFLAQTRNIQIFKDKKYCFLLQRNKVLSPGRKCCTEILPAYLQVVFVAAGNRKNLRAREVVTKRSITSRTQKDVLRLKFKVRRKKYVSQQYLNEAKTTAWAHLF